MMKHRSSVGDGKWVGGVSGALFVDEHFHLDDDKDTDVKAVQGTELSSASEPPSVLPGEITAFRATSVTDRTASFVLSGYDGVGGASLSERSGTLFFTNFRIIFVPLGMDHVIERAQSDAANSLRSPQWIDHSLQYTPEVLTIPLGMIEKVDVLPERERVREDSRAWSLRICCKCPRKARFTFTYGEVTPPQQVLDILRDLSFPSTIRALFPFASLACQASERRRSAIHLPTGPCSGTNPQPKTSAEAESNTAGTASLSESNSASGSQKQFAGSGDPSASDAKSITSSDSNGSETSNRSDVQAAKQETNGATPTEKKNASPPKDKKKPVFGSRFVSSLHLLRDYQRQGLNPRRWKITRANAFYNLCPTYSSHVIVPAGVSEAKLEGSAAFREKKRLPVLSYRHRGTGGVICRCAQPRTGLTRSRSSHDEDVVAAIFQSVYGYVPTPVTLGSGGEVLSSSPLQQDSDIIQGKEKGSAAHARISSRSDGVNPRSPNRLSSASDVPVEGSEDLLLASGSVSAISGVGGPTRTLSDVSTGSFEEPAEATKEYTSSLSASMPHPQQSSSWADLKASYSAGESVGANDFPGETVDFGGNRAAVGTSSATSSPSRPTEPKDVCSNSPNGSADESLAQSGMTASVAPVSSESRDPRMPSSGPISGVLETLDEGGGPRPAHVRTSVRLTSRHPGLPQDDSASKRFSAPPSSSARPPPAAIFGDRAASMSSASLSSGEASGRLSVAYRGVRAKRKDSIDVIAGQGCNPAHTLYIVDLRSKTAARGNQVAGGGVENSANYHRTEAFFLGLDNIHSVRNAYVAIRELCCSRVGLLAMRGWDCQSMAMAARTPVQPSTTAGAAVASALSNVASAAVGGGRSQWLAKVEATRWLELVAQGLEAAVHIATLAGEKGHPVLVHCTDGWDRTVQTITLARIMLDPYVRTCAGFRMLIEREWSGMGHMFRTRCGHANEAHDDQRSPVFILWLDCVYQLMVQFPTAFEFNVDFLVQLADALYECRYLDFLFDSEREREETLKKANLGENETGPDSPVPVSFFDACERKATLFVNPMYRQEVVLLSPHCLCGVGALTLWREYFFRFVPSVVPPSPLTAIQAAASLIRMQNEELEVLRSGLEEARAQRAHLEGVVSRLMSHDYDSTAVVVDDSRSLQLHLVDTYIPS
eukprot:Rmarinus@m.16032